MENCGTLAAKLGRGFLVMVDSGTGEQLGKRRVHCAGVVQPRHTRAPERLPRGLRSSKCRFDWLPDLRLRSPYHSIQLGLGNILRPKGTAQAHDRLYCAGRVQLAGFAVLLKVANAVADQTLGHQLQQPSAASSTAPAMMPSFAATSAISERDRSMISRANRTQLAVAMPQVRQNWLIRSRVTCHARPPWRARAARQQPTEAGGIRARRRVRAAAAKRRHDRRVPPGPPDLDQMPGYLGQKRRHLRAERGRHRLLGMRPCSHHRVRMPFHAVAQRVTEQPQQLAQAHR